MKKFLLAALAIAAFIPANAEVTVRAHVSLDNGAAVNEVTGTAFTLNTNTLNDVVGTSTPTSVEGIAGETSTGTHFDGNCYYFLPMADLGDASFFDGSFTVALWAKMESYEGNDSNNGVASYLLHIGDSQTLQWIGLEYNKNQNIQLFSRAGTSGSSGRNVAAGIPVDEWGTYWLLDGNWHYIVGVKRVNAYDAENNTVDGTWELYLDNGKNITGEEVGEPIKSAGLRIAANNYSFPAGAGVTIGTNFTDATPYPTHGGIDEVYIYEGALTLEEIQENYVNMTDPAGINDIIADMGENTVVNVYNLNGMLVGTTTGNVENALNGLNPDMYVVKVSNGTNTVARKFIVR